MLHALVTPLITPLVLVLADPTPEPEDVKAGWLAFALFIGLILAVVFLGFSLVKQLRKAQAAQDAGVYDEPDDTRPSTGPKTGPSA
jgi:hypothetical protein